MSTDDKNDYDGAMAIVLQTFIFQQTKKYSVMVFISESYFREFLCIYLEIKYDTTQIILLRKTMRTQNRKEFVNFKGTSSFWTN